MTDTVFRIAVVGFAHMHAGDQLRVIESTSAVDLVGVWDTEPARRDAVADDLGVPTAVRYDDLDTLLTESAPDIAVVCSTTGEHTELVELLAGRGIHVILEKPFALTLDDADRMIAASDAAGTILAVNWPLAWYPAHLTTQRLIAEGLIGDVTEVHYYDGNRGPLTHVHDKVDRVDPDLAAKAASWWYQPEFGGGSLLDYLGYGSTIATWFRQGELPERLTALAWGTDGLRVDEQSVVAAAYASGLSTFQTKWGTFSNPWQHQPAPQCGFVVVGTEGTITSRDFAPAVDVATIDHPEGIAIPVDTPRPEQTGAIGHVVHCLNTGTQPTGPASKELSRAGQQIVDTAVLSVTSGRTVALLDPPPPYATTIERFMTTLTVAPADVSYLPSDPATTSARIALIGCGGISEWHLAAYQAAGYSVVALCDLVAERAEARQQQFFPEADVYTDHRLLLARTDIDVVDIATHVDVRPGLVREALDAGKDVLSQKPFVREIADGEDLVAYAKEHHALLAANQNGRWAPHFAYALAAIRAGVIGEVTSADFWVHWPHDQVVGDSEIFSHMQDLILFDFGIHWFDLVAQIFAGKRATEVTARVKSVAGSEIPVPTNAHVIIDFDDVQASMRYRGSSHFAEEAGYRIEGTAGVLTHSGGYLGGETVTVTTAAGTEDVSLQGSWFTNGMHGSMAELLKAREEGRAPANDASTVLASLQLCYAALQSARTRTTVDPSTVNSADR